MDSIDKARIIPIIDDFHFISNKEKLVADLSEYVHQIFIVDDIFNLNFLDENIVKSFTRFSIKEFMPSLRHQLIFKWIKLADSEENIGLEENIIYQKIDSKTEIVNVALGKLFGAGIMPSYPFFILSVINIYDTFEKPLDQEITSQGYCYQALIYMYLRKEGVANDEIDTYINFLAEFAFYLYKENKSDLPGNEFDKFMKQYYEKYNLPVNQNVLIAKLHKTQILELDAYNNYSFCYMYLYYFFVAKYLADHVERSKEDIDHILNNLQINQNAYIAMFISHHTKSDYVLDELLLNAFVMFDKHKPATLEKNEIDFFDEQVDSIVKAVLPSAASTPENKRAQILKSQDEAEENVDGNESENSSDFSMNLRKSIKTVEVMGSILKNRAGSLEKARLEEVLQEAMKVHLRILTYFLELIKDKNEQELIVSFLSEELRTIMDNKEKLEKSEKSKPIRTDREKIEKLSRKIFWNLNFMIVYAIINKIVKSLGSNKLIGVIDKVCDSENTPAAFLIKHGIFMWYNKNLQINNIADKISHDGFSEIAKQIIRLMVVNHCALHKIGFKERQKAEKKLGIPSQRLLVSQAKGNEE
jgi:hypothetical protein